MNKLSSKLFSILFCCSILVTCGQSDPFKIVFISGSNEYFSNLSLRDYKNYLEETVENVRITMLQADGEINFKGEYSNLQGLEALDDCDVLLLFTRRITIDGEQLEAVKKYITSGRPLVAIRTASHGLQNWLEFDKLVLGGNYNDHYDGAPEQSVRDEDGNRIPDPAGVITGFTQRIKIEPGAENHPVLKGIKSFNSRYSLYKTGPVAPDVQVLMTGYIPNKEMAKQDGRLIYYNRNYDISEPSVWTRTYNGARISYIAIGGLQDWKSSTYKRLVTNALFWTGKREPEYNERPEPKQRPMPTGEMDLVMRSRIEVTNGNDTWQELALDKNWKIAETAIIICDMWDQHWCSASSKRTLELAIKMNPILKQAREKGIQIIHAPSGTMGFYDDWPQRMRMINAPNVPKPSPLIADYLTDDFSDHPKPIEDEDECEVDGDIGYGAWTRQTSLIDIGEYDGISDRGNETYNFYKQQGIKNLIVMGVHTNYCILTRSFTLRQMKAWGINCVLVRDLTDSMYDPGNYPYVSHDEGTRLMVEYIEKYWAPSMLSEDFVAALDSAR